MKVAYINFEETNNFLITFKKFRTNSLNLELVISFVINHEMIEYCFKHKIPFCYINKDNIVRSQILISKISKFDIDLVSINDIFIEIKANKKSPNR